MQKNFVRKHRTELGLSYEDIADKLGVHPVTVRNWEKKRVPRLIRLAFIQAYTKHSCFCWTKKPRQKRRSVDKES